VLERIGGELVQDERERRRGRRAQVHVRAFDVTPYPTSSA
jgi:hypothetical protein